jgi:membrane-associated tyrosine/threonine-specific cdc2-inhibitory kinase
MIVDKSPVPVPEQSVFDTKVFSAKKTPNNRLKCPSPPLKTPPVSRVFANQPLFTPTAKVIATPGASFLQTPDYNRFITPPNSSFFEEFFENLGEIGSGSFGHVYKARSKADGCLYAVKKSRHQFRGTKDRQRAIGEVWFAAQLPPHPHVLHYVNAWEEQGYLFIQTELCDKGSLKDYLEASAPIPEETVWGYLLDMILGIQHIHSHNLLHLDMKPANLFLSANGSLKIGDFGLVHQLEDTSYDIEGDSRYMALELLNEDTSRVSLPADIFCIGATCFEMVANVEMPSNGVAWAELRQGQVAHFLASTPASVDLCQLIEQMMAPDPMQRPTAEKLLDHWKLRQLVTHRRNSGHFPSVIQQKQTNVEALPEYIPCSPHSTPSASPVYSFPPSPVPVVASKFLDDSIDDSYDDDDFLLPRNNFAQEREQFRRQSLESYGVKATLQLDNEMFQEDTMAPTAAIAPRNLLDVFNNVEDDGMEDD